MQQILNFIRTCTVCLA